MTSIRLPLPRFRLLTTAALAALAVGCATLPAPSATSTEALASALAGSHRTPAFVARDAARRPKETLAFFDVQPQHVVVEIWPGGAGWYTEILAPYLREDGLYVGAIQPVSLPSTDDYARKGAARFRDKLAAQPAVYDRAVVSEFRAPERRLPVVPGSADRVLTFRNVHNWIEGGWEAEAFDAFYDLLKPGGVLGVVEHRAKPGTRRADSKDSGYVTEAYVRALAEAAGFEFAGASTVNDNPRDTKDHPKGVWSLPPVLAMKDVDRERYLAIGESDRMTLKFVKPAAP